MMYIYRHREKALKTVAILQKVTISLEDKNKRGGYY